MTFSKLGRIVSALVATAALGLGMTACGGGTIGYMWVLGTYYNQISGFKIDDYTGNLTAINHSPFSSNGTNPVSIVLRPGGRYVYVVNGGTASTVVNGKPTAATGSSIAQFAVGGDGILTFQQNFFSTGTQPVWAAMDTSGNYLYVLDKYSPYYGTTNAAGTLDQNGAISVFSIAGDTGKLTLVTNTQILTSNNLPTLAFEVGPNPVMTKVGLGSCLFTLSPTSIYPYQINSATGQLTIASTGPYLQFPANANLSSINTGTNSSSSYVYVTDKQNNTIDPLQSGGTQACTLGPVSGSSTSLPLNNPVNSVTSSNGTYLYVLNQTNTSSTGTANSSITAFHIDGAGRLTNLADPVSNPYAVGSGPVCLSFDPTNQYLYTSNMTDNTVTGKIYDPTRGFLRDLSRGTVFPSTMSPSCLVVSGNI